VLGGARSGKSAYAVSLARESGGRVAFLATAEALDREMATRIERHRRERPGAWLTVEEPVDLVPALRRLADRVDLVVVDCLTLWVSNLLQRGMADEPILAEADALAKLLGERHFSLILVSNEVGQGVHPETAQGLRFRDLLGLVNQRVAAAADRVLLMVAGCPLTLKAPPVYEPSTDTL
jgi:adenosylcobinamide kinase/adenosylcobinamide-phosphate guanylyltransferase